MAAQKRPSIPTDVKTKLWLSAGGRCQFEGCNKALWRDDVSLREMNISYIAHIYGYAPGSERYDAVLSPQLEKDFSNLMLMCDAHHRQIDNKPTSEEFSVDTLQKMKKEHEKRIELLTGLKQDKRSHVLFLGANIGNHASPLNINNAFESLLPDYFPASSFPIELGINNFSMDDSFSRYWEIQVDNLETQFSQKVAALKGKHEVQHFSIFGLAPMPLLIKFGTLLSDIYAAEVYQLHREPSTWKWLEETTTVNHQLIPATGNGSVVALKLELSANITDDRITEVLGDECDIWSIRLDSPNNDYIRCKSDLKNFRVTMRKAFDEIKLKYGQKCMLHIFPAMPVCVSVELGRVWMPKADMPMKIYDQNSKLGGFQEAILIR